MSLITRCPACGTMFKVVPDQLRISEGWVRCGHCADVFDAAAHLQGEAAERQIDAAVTTPDALTAQPIAAVAVAERKPGAAADASDAGPESEAFESSLNTEIDEAMSFEAPDSAQIDAEAQALVEHPLDRPFEFRRRDEGEIGPRTRPADSEFESELESDADSQAEARLREVSFVRDAQRKAFWERPRIRAALLIAVLALSVVLALQIALHDRDRLAAASPALRPWLASLCVPLSCRIGPPRQIDAIAIDSSSFAKLRGDAYRLNFTLKNQAATEVAMPALELTLTDVQDQAVIRRVLLPADLGARVSVIAAASEWSGSLALVVSANGSGARVAGYRLLAFYP